MAKHTVQITLARLGDAAATLLLVLLEHTDLLKRLHDLAVDGARGIGVVRGAEAPVLGGAVDLAETANADSLPHVDVAGNGGGTDVEPVNVLRRQLLGAAGLDSVNPTCQRTWSASGSRLRTAQVSKLTGNGQLALALQESSIGVDELVRLERRERRPSAIVPSSEVLRLPRACSHHLSCVVFLCDPTPPHSCLSPRRDIVWSNVSQLQEPSDQDRNGPSSSPSSVGRKIRRVAGGTHSRYSVLIREEV